MICSSLPNKNRIVYFSCLIPRISYLGHELDAIRSWNRKLRRIEKLCHCEFRVDASKILISHRLFEWYHLIEIFYHPRRGNHLGCMRLLAELIDTHGPMQPVISVSHTPSGRILRRNFLSDDVNYRLFHDRNETQCSSKIKSKLASFWLTDSIASIKTHQLTSANFKHQKNSEVLISIGSSGSPAMDSAIYSTELHYPSQYREIARINNSTEVPRDDSLIIRKCSSIWLATMLADIDRSSFSEFLYISTDKHQLEPLFRHQKSGDHFYEEEDEFASAVSNMSSNFTSSSDEFEDAQSTGSERCQQNIDCDGVLMRLNATTPQTIRAIHAVIDDLAEAAFERGSVKIRWELMRHVTTARLALHQCVRRLLDETQVCLTAHYVCQVFASEDEIWTSVLNNLVTAIDRQFWGQLLNSSLKVSSTLVNTTLKTNSDPFCSIDQSTLVNLNMNELNTSYQLSKENDHRRQKSLRVITSIGNFAERQNAAIDLNFDVDDDIFVTSEQRNSSNCAQLLQTDHKTSIERSLDTVFMDCLSELVRHPARLLVLSIDSQIRVVVTVAQQLMISPVLENGILRLCLAETAASFIFGVKIYQDTCYRLANRLVGPKPQLPLPPRQLELGQCEAIPHTTLGITASPNLTNLDVPLKLPLRNPSMRARRPLLRRRGSYLVATPVVCLHRHLNAHIRLDLPLISLQHTADDFLSAASQCHIFTAAASACHQPRLSSLLLALLIYPLCHSRLDLTLLGQALLDTRPLYCFVQHWLPHPVTPGSSCSGSSHYQNDSFYSARSASVIRLLVSDISDPLFSCKGDLEDDDDDDDDDDNDDDDDDDDNDDDAEWCSACEDNDNHNSSMVLREHAFVEGHKSRPRGLSEILNESNSCISRRRNSYTMVAHHLFPKRRAILPRNSDVTDSDIGVATVEFNNASCGMLLSHMNSTSDTIQKCVQSVMFPSDLCQTCGEMYNVLISYSTELESNPQSMSTLTNMATMDTSLYPVTLSITQLTSSNHEIPLMPDPYDIVPLLLHILNIQPSPLPSHCRPAIDTASTPFIQQHYNTDVNIMKQLLLTEVTFFIKSAALTWTIHADLQTILSDLLQQCTRHVLMSTADLIITSKRIVTLEF